MNMCAVCGSRKSQRETADEVFKAAGEFVLVKHIPADVCVRCGEQSVSLETAEAVRRAVNGGAEPHGCIEMRVFQFESTESHRTADVSTP